MWLLEDRMFISSSRGGKPWKPGETHGTLGCDLDLGPRLAAVHGHWLSELLCHPPPPPPSAGQQHLPAALNRTAARSTFRVCRGWLRKLLLPLLFLEGFLPLPQGFSDALRDLCTAVGLHVPKNLLERFLSGFKTKESVRWEIIIPGLQSLLRPVQVLEGSGTWDSKGAGAHPQEPD